LRNVRVQRSSLAYAAVQQRIEMRRISLVKAHEIAGEGVDFIGRILPDQMLVQPLQRELAGTGAGALFGVFERLRAGASISGF